MFGILPLIEDKLKKTNNRGLPISPVLQLLICLRFYSTASFQVSNKIVLNFNKSSNKIFYLLKNKIVFLIG